MNRLLPRAALLIPLATAVLGLVLLLTEPIALQVLRNSLFDQYQRWYPRPEASVPVRIIDIDEASLARLGQWPWPRTRLAGLVDRLNEAGAAAIGFDMVFAEADRTSPAAIAELWSLDGNLRAALDKLPDHDRAFAQSIGRAPVVLGFALDRLVRGLPEPRQTPQSPARPYRYINIGSPSDRWLPGFAVATPALPLLETAAQGNGALSFVPDSDGVIRRVPLALRLGEQPVSTLAAELLRVGQSERNIVLKAAAETDTGLAEVRIGDFTIPVTARGEMWIHYSAPRADLYIPAWKVLAGEVPKSLLENHLVLIGTSAQGLMDLRFSPLGRILPGVEVHAQALEQILSGRYLQRPSRAVAAEALALIAGALLIGFASLRIKALSAACVSLLCLAGLWGSGWYAFRQNGLLIDTVTPSIAYLATFVLCSLVHHLISEREQRWIRAAFSRYVSPNRVAHLIEHPSDIALGGHRQECSFVFTDLARFTHLMERVDPVEAVALLNSYLDRMIAIAFRHEGTLDRIVGDAVAIMFSAPVPQPDHKARALACGLEMLTFSHRYAGELQARGIEFGKTRIGIHSGDVIVGNIGGSTIFDYRALGDAVNTASRLEGANKYLGTSICVSETTLAGCPAETLVRPVGRLILKGKTESVMVYEPVSPDLINGHAPEAEYRRAYELMIAHNDEFDSAASALDAFRSLSEHYPDDPLVALHLNRLQNNLHGDLIVMSEK